MIPLLAEMSGAETLEAIKVVSEAVASAVMTAAMAWALVRIMSGGRK
jgi:hypothetical protein